MKNIDKILILVLLNLVVLNSCCIDTKHRGFVIVQMIHCYLICPLPKLLMIIYIGAFTLRILLEYFQKTQ